MKKLFVTLLLSVLLFSTLGIKASAEEEASPLPTEEITEEKQEEKQEETILDLEEKTDIVGEMVSDFIDKWQTVFISTSFSAVASALIAFLAKLLFKKTTKKLEDDVNLSAEERKKNKEAQEKSLEIMESSKKELIDTKQEFLNMAQELKKECKSVLNTADIQCEEFEQIKSLLALMISTNPEFASNGYATQLLQILGGGLDETKEEN